MNQRVSEERTSLIRLHEHTLTVQPDAIRVLIFSFYDFSECHLTLLISDPSASLRMTWWRGASRRLSRAGREKKPAKRMFREARKAGLL